MEIVSTNSPNPSKTSGEPNARHTRPTTPTKAKRQTHRQVEEGGEEDEEKTMTYRHTQTLCKIIDFLKSDGHSQDENWRIHPTADGTATIIKDDVTGQEYWLGMELLSKGKVERPLTVNEVLHRGGM